MSLSVASSLDPDAADRRRRTADHEAIHVAAAYVLGWTVFGATVDSGGHGGDTTFQAPARRTDAQRLREQLAITAAPSAVADRDGRGDFSAADARDVWELANKIVGGDACVITNSQRARVVDEAMAASRRLSEQPRFQRLRHAVAFVLERQLSVKGSEIARLAAGVEA